MARPITFLSDYGADDEFAGVCRAVIARIAPEATVIDLTHGIARHQVRQGAAVLAHTLPFAPPGVHLAVVDPEVGTERRAVAIRVTEEDRVLVGPDNGLLWPAIERLGGPLEAADISLSPFRLEPLSATFHGRDVFAPVAATLAQGATLEEVGAPLSPSALTTLESSQARIEDGRTFAHVSYLDHYGNAVLDVGEPRLPETRLRLGRPVGVETGGSGSAEAIFARTFADVAEGELLVYLDSYKSVALAVNRGSAAAELNLAPGDEVVLRPL
ncbi:MAG: SAM-dependent chlorinase/fluorinase [Actinomycetota bacterium]